VLSSFVRRVLLRVSAVLSRSAEWIDRRGDDRTEATTAPERLPEETAPAFGAPNAFQRHSPAPPAHWLADIRGKAPHLLAGEWRSGDRAASSLPPDRAPARPPFASHVEATADPVPRVEEAPSTRTAPPPSVKGREAGTPALANADEVDRPSVARGLSAVRQPAEQRHRHREPQAEPPHPVAGRARTSGPPGRPERTDRRSSHSDGDAADGFADEVTADAASREAPDTASRDHGPPDPGSRARSFGPDVSISPTAIRQTPPPPAPPDTPFRSRRHDPAKSKSEEENGSAGLRRPAPALRNEPQPRHGEVVARPAIAVTHSRDDDEAETTGVLRPPTESSQRTPTVFSEARAIRGRTAKSAARSRKRVADPWPQLPARSVTDWRSELTAARNEFLRRERVDREQQGVPWNGWHFSSSARANASDVC